MSGICGIVNFDGAPVDPELLKRMTEAAAYRGPDGIHYWIEGNVGLAHLALHTTPESLRERQPLVNRRGDLVLVADARVDNREELIRTLTTKGYIEDKDPTDADLILAAYECWGEDCVIQLIGDFSFSIWDKRYRKLVAYRDRAGCRTFYYHSTRNRFIWATEVSQILTIPGIPARIDELMVAQDLIAPGHGGIHNSYYLDINKLGQAEKLNATGNVIKVERYWDINPSLRVTYDKPEDYVEHFLYIFREAVRSRIRSIHHTGVFLSGGLDSTSVASISADEVKTGRAEYTSSVQGYTWDSKKWPEYSEIDRSSAVAKKWNFPNHEIVIDEAFDQFNNPLYAPHRDEPHECLMYAAFIACFNHPSSTVQPRNWLSGHAGDTIVGASNVYYYFDLLKKFQFVELFKKQLEHAKLYNLPSTYILINYILKPLLQEVRNNVLPIRNPIKTKINIPDWISPNLAERVRLVSWLEERQEIRRKRRKEWLSEGGRAEKIYRYFLIHYQPDVRVRVWLERQAAKNKMHTSSPFDDVRLLEYGMAIPEVQNAEGFNHKLLLRKAMADYLPSLVRERKTLRTGIPLAIKHIFQTESAKNNQLLLFNNSLLANFDFINVEALKDILFNTDKSMHFHNIYQVISTEIWLRTFYHK